MKSAVVAVALVLALCAPASAGPRDGVAAFERGDYTAAMEELAPLAEANDAEAQYYLGAMYEAGLGVSQDYFEATRWYVKAAETGLAKAQFHLGLLYETGEGVKKDYGRAARWYRRAAEQGYAPAQSNLGRLYLMGWGVRKDFFRSYVWSSIAIRQGYHAARAHSKKAAARLSSDDIAKAQKLARERARKFGK